MQRMQRAMQENISPKMGDAATFAKAAADIRLRYPKERAP